MAASRIALVGVLTGSLGACASTTLYPGPHRPDSETMLVETNGTQIVSIDDLAPQMGSRFRLLPGAHRVEVVLGPGVYSSRGSMPVCFSGRPGHAYLVRPQFFGGYGYWRPEVIDENVTYPIADTDCSPPRRPEMARAAAAQPPQAAPSTEPATPDAGTPDGGGSAIAAAEPPPVATGAPAGSSQGDTAPSPEVGTPAAQKPRAGRVASTDDEAPRPPRVTTSALPPLYKPKFDLGAEIGLAQGGEELVTATNSNGDMETLGTGDGLLLAFTARVTPLWLSDTVGIGVGGSAGYKVWSVGGTGGEASMSKYLLTGLGHLAISLDERWLLIVQGGVEKDYDISLSINNTSSGVPFRSRVGFVIDVGARRKLDDYWSVGFSLRGTILDYAVENVSLSANSITVTLSIHCGS